VYINVNLVGIFLGNL